MKIYIYFTILLIASSLIVNWFFPAYAWRITKELKQELAVKEAAVKANPNDAVTQFDLAVTYAYTNHLIDGMKTISRIPELNPKFKNQAIATYVEEVTAKPADWRLRFRLAFAYYFNDMKTLAIKEFENVLKLDPYNVWAYGYIALIYGEMGEVDKAIAKTRAGLTIDSNVAALHLLLGEGYIKKGDSWGGWKERLEAVRLKSLVF